MANLKSIRSWNAIWEKVQSFFGFSGVDSPFVSGPAVIDEPLTLYVETTGNDANPGTVDRPYRTIQAALDYLRGFEIGAQVDVKVGLGNFKGFVMGGYSLTSAGSVVVSGTLVSTGVSGTLTSNASYSGATNLATLTDLTRSWTVDEHVGKLVRLSHSSAPLGPYYYPVAANTATTISIPISISNLAWDYEFVTHGTVIDGSVAGTNVNMAPFLYSVGEVAVLSTLTSGIVFVGGGTGQSSSGQLMVRRIKVTQSSASTGLCVYTRGLAYASCEACYFSQSRSGVGTVDASGGAQLAFNRTIIQNFNNVGYRQPTTSTFPASSFSSSVFWGGATGMQIQTGTVSLNSVHFRDQTSVGLSLIGGTAGHVNLSGISFSKCVTGMSLVKGVNFGSSNAPGLAFADLTTGILCNTGSVCQIASAGTFTNVTNELSVDGVVSTIAAMRASSPKIFPLTPNPYGSYVYE